jgi:hypothetical protein
MYLSRTRSLKQILSRAFSAGNTQNCCLKVKINVGESVVAPTEWYLNTRISFSPIIRQSYDLYLNILHVIDIITMVHI